MLVNIECPIELLEYELYESKSTGKIYCSLTFNSVSDKIIKGLKATIYCYDQFGDSIGEGNNSLECKIEFKEGLVRNRKRKTDNKIPLSDFQNIRKIEIDVIKVLFDDKSIWNKDTSESEKVELTKIENKMLLEFVKGRAGTDAKYFAKKYDDKWICVCGRLNHDDQSTCKRCKRGRDDVLTEYSDEEKIRNDVKANEEKKAERQRKVEEEREQQLEITKQKAKKVTKYSSIVAVIILIVGVTVFGFITKFTFSMANHQLLKDKDNPVVETIKDENLVKDDFLLENGAEEDLQNSGEEKPLLVDGIIDTSFVWGGGNNARGDFTIKYRKNGSVKNKQMNGILEPLIVDIDNNGVKEIVMSYRIDLPELSNADMPYWDDVYDFNIAKEELVFASREYPEYYRSYFIPSIKKREARSTNAAEKHTHEVLIRAANDLIDGNFNPDVNQEKITKLLEDNTFPDDLKITIQKNNFYIHGITLDMNISQAIKMLGNPDESFEVDSKVAVWYLEHNLELVAEYYGETIHYIALGEFDQMAMEQSMSNLGEATKEHQNGHLYITPSQHLFYSVMSKPGSFRVELTLPGEP
ncbi:hypothetical protein [Paenibacillus sp. IHBB 10380]|uniref:hypothetical protein n=1 Tax=Paenibacillus sp. IHBB 10380 TaxID=1566358 RepID=UPI0005CFC93B|nr:hypothetical protein [Paenibacillus sp. IHBB 10380]AJS61198.1 hypothetical protein UB51_25275 [Paenibacillus sp. IHBB 10380]